MAEAKKATAKAEPKNDAGRAEVQKRIDAENAQGFRGTEVDPTPNENYTVAGVTSGAPTPETDPGAYAEANPNKGKFAGGGALSDQGESAD